MRTVQKSWSKQYKNQAN